MDEHERCTQCDFDGARLSDEELLDELDELGARWQRAFDVAHDDLRTRPAPEVWSTLEYAAHSRDVTALHVFGVTEALKGSEPDFGEIEGDALISEAASRYNDEEPRDVLDALSRESRNLSGVARDAGTPLWDRGLTVASHRSTVRRLLEHALHDSTHHLDDVRRGVEQIRSRKTTAFG